MNFPTEPATRKRKEKGGYHAQGITPSDRTHRNYGDLVGGAARRAALEEPVDDRRRRARRRPHRELPRDDPSRGGQRRGRAPDEERQRMLDAEHPESRQPVAPPRRPARQHEGHQGSDARPRPSERPHSALLTERRNYNEARDSPRAFDFYFFFPTCSERSQEGLTFL